MRLSRIWRIKQIEEGVIHRGRRPRWITSKNNSGSNKQKSNFARAAHFFVHFFDCPCFALLQLETSRNFLVTRFMGRLSSVFFHCRSFSPWWPLAFLIFSLPLQNFHVSPTKNASLPFLFRSSSFSRWVSLACCPSYSFSLSFSFSIFQICRHDN